MVVALLVEIVLLVEMVLLVGDSVADKETRPGCFCAKDCQDSVEMCKWWYTFTCTGGGGL